MGKTVGDTVVASGPHGPVTLRGTGAVMTMQGAAAVSALPMPRNVFLVSLRGPGNPAAISSLKQQFPGIVLPAVPPPEVRDLSGVSGLPLILAFVLMLLACGIIAHTLGLLAGRWAWTLFAGQEAIVPAPVISPLTLLAVPAVLLLANAIFS